ncbi:MAG: Gfo/Idh/MocA family oxidoreductase, partial [Aeoliella sp.]
MVPSKQSSHPFRRSTVNRRRFLQATLAATAPLLLSRRCFAASPNETLNLASVGVGGKGWSDLTSSAAGKNVRVVALCDVDANNLGHAASKFTDAAKFADYRRMFDKTAGDIDAVLVSTPDHRHAPVALAAMALGKHVHVQKPLANSLSDLRQMQEMAADNPNLVTQMGTQIHSHEAYRTGAAMIREGAIGKVSEAHLWVGKSWVGPKTGRPDKTDPVPPHLDWDLWLGASPERPYVDKIYHPASWRGWKDFGAGTLGDMGCHIFDPVFSALD